MKPSETPKLFGRYHDLIFLILGFILTTFVGGYLTQSYQERAAGQQRVAAERQAELAAADAVFQELSRLMDRRLFRMRRLHTALVSSNINEAEVDRIWTVYRNALFQWNENLNRSLALTEKYFGEEGRSQLEEVIQPLFIKLGSRLEKARHTRLEERHFGDWSDDANALSSAIYDFNLYMIDAIQFGRVGRFRDGDLHK